MSLLTDLDNPPPTKRRWPYFVVLVFLSVVLTYFYFPDPPTQPEPVKEPRPEAATESTPEPSEAESIPEEAESFEVPPPLELNLTPEPEPVVTPAPIVLRVTSDVEGADVFIDRRYVGTTPFESSDLTAGRHRVNVSALGYESHAEDITIGDDTTSVNVLFTEVLLDETIKVVHKHRFGNCTGELVASTSGIRYHTNDDDAFEVSFDGLDEFTVDYLEHNLQLKV